MFRAAALVSMVFLLGGCAIYCNGWATRGCLTPRSLETLAGEGRSQDLVEYLHDDRSWVREEAAKALGEMKAKDAEAGLIAVLRSPTERPYVRAASARALGRIGSPSSFPDLSGLVASSASPPELKLALIDALCSYDGQEPLTVLTPLGSDEDILVAAKAEKAVRSKCGR
jgi:HEAT repeat protein